ncbi:MAG: excinuclease ABC subunit UvrB [Phycisphaerales bacterium]|nr:excinuclease ABC subunit UvrB [Phycisphaerales bacterium]
MGFHIQTSYQPAGDQPHAIAQLTKGIQEQQQFQTLLGVTGSGKTFTIANVIQATQMPTLVITHNKTLVAQLYGEFKHFFPNNAVGYFVSYYDYYQPESYLPVTNTYIEKDLNINEDIEKLRLQATNHLLTGRRDIIIVASVSCIYGMGNPEDFKNGIVHIKVGQELIRQNFLYALHDALYTRSTGLLLKANYRVKGEVVDIYPPYLEQGYRICFYGNIIESIEIIDLITNQRISKIEDAAIFPANLYVAPKDRIHQIIAEIQEELCKQTDYFKSIGKRIEAIRLKERVEYDIEMIKQLGYCKGIENYSRFFDQRAMGSRPFCLIDYFPKDFLCIIDESHQTIPQISGMSGGDRSRKMTLVEHGFRLPSAIDNRPLNFNEFENMLYQTIFVSATPGNYELEKTGGEIIEQIIRPTGLLDPPIDVRPTLNQIDNLIEEIHQRIKQKERVLVTTLTKKMAEELFKFLDKIDIPTRYIHSDIDAIERVQILRDLRLGKISVLVGVNLLREGLDLPEVSLVAILDADKEGFLRNERSLTQTAGRAARNVHGLVIFYADKITDSMMKTIDETNRRRIKQIQFNTDHHIQPKTILKSVSDILEQTNILSIKGDRLDNEDEVVGQEVSIVAEVNNNNNNNASATSLNKEIIQAQKKMKDAVKIEDFMEAARWRDKIKELKKKQSSFS